MKPKHLCTKFVGIATIALATIAIAGCSKKTAVVVKTEATPATSPSSTAPEAAATSAAPPATSLATASPATSSPTTTAGTKPATTASTAVAALVAAADIEQAQLDCVYGENEANACARLVASGLTSERNYGLGNSLTMAPNGTVRKDCLAGRALPCAELNSRVVAAVADGTNKAQLTCLFFAPIGGSGGGVIPKDSVQQLDILHLRTLVGVGPVGVLAAINTVETKGRDAAAVQSLEGYFRPICGNG